MCWQVPDDAGGSLAVFYERKGLKRSAVKAVFSGLSSTDSDVVLYYRDVPTARLAPMQRSPNPLETCIERSRTAVTQSMRTLFLGGEANYNSTGAKEKR